MIIIDREDLEQCHFDWLHYCAFACAYHTPVSACEINAGVNT